MGFTKEFPSECSSHIFSFLELSDCLRVCETSLTMMKEIMPTLNKRRASTKEKYSYFVERIEVRDGDFHDCIEFKSMGLHEKIKQKFPSVDLVPIPTLEDQIVELSNRIPESHHYYRFVKELQRELQYDVDDEDIDYVAPYFTRLFPMLQKILRPLKVYILLLSGVIRSRPVDLKSAKISLDEYIGDVLCATFLINEGSASLAELSPLVSKLLNEIQIRKDSSSYISWVFLHSTLLRTKQFSRQERDRLGIPDFKSFHVIGNNVVPMDCFLNENFMSSEMTLMLDNDGPFDRTFRLRDIVQLHGMSSHCLLSFFNSIDIDNTNDRGEAAQMALEWMCLAHEEVRRNSHMTGRQSVVRLDCTH